MNRLHSSAELEYKAQSEDVYREQVRQIDNLMNEPVN